MAYGEKAHSCDPLKPLQCLDILCRKGNTVNSYSIPPKVDGCYNPPLAISTYIFSFFLYENKVLKWFHVTVA